MDKKTARLKEMEARRQQVLQKKAEEEKSREEKRIKEENDRRKRDREDNTEKRALKQPGKKVCRLVSFYTLADTHCSAHSDGR